MIKKNQNSQSRVVRSRNNDWAIRQKRADTLVKTIEKTYWKDLWVRSDKKLWNYLKDKWYDSLSKLMKSI